MRKSDGVTIPQSVLTKARAADAMVRVDDEPLSDDQRRKAVKLIAGADPVLILAAMHKVASHPRSKLKFTAELHEKILTTIHDRTYPPPDRTRRVSSDNQFELEFMWSTDGEERVAIADFTRVDDEQSDRR